ncbi:MAG: tetratricopeptide repeat protein [Longimicrobiales bacterium]
MRGDRVRGEGADKAFPPWPVAPAAAASVAFEEFTGAETCAECHGAQYDAWLSSTHGRAGGELGRVTPLRAFDGEPIRFRNATVTPRAVDGEFAFVVAQEGREDRMLRVDGVIGGGHMVGGGTQGFVTRYEDGTLRFLPFELVRREGVWFCNTGTRLDRGWVPITEDMALADCGDWPPVRVLGDVARFASCQGCHGSQITVEPQPGRPHATRLVGLTINCESCHGPGRVHVGLARSGRIVEAADIGMRSLATLSEDASLEVCFRCHALKDALSPGDLPGEPLAEHYSLALPLLGESPVFADGRIRTFGYQQGHLYSACYRNGSMTCVDCHEPHGQGYRDVQGRQLTGRFDDGQCTACHASKAVAPERHTHHAAESEGSRCVACHMPYLQEPEVGTALRYARSDHTIPIPRPAFDARLGVEVACQLCHEDHNVETLQADVDRWWGELKPQPPVVARLAAADTAQRQPSLPGSADRRVPAAIRQPTAAESQQPFPSGRGRRVAPGEGVSDARPPSSSLTVPELVGLATDTAGQHTMARFAALAELLTAVSRPDAGELDEETAGQLRFLADDANDDIAAAALAALHYARGDRTPTRQFLVDAIRELGERERRVRLRWGVLLGFLGDQHREAGEAAAAIATYRKALEVRPGHAPTLLSVGLAYAAGGDPAAAENAYQQSLARDSTNSLTWVNLGIARAARGDAAGAVAAYQRAIAANAYDPLPHFNLGNMYLRADDPRRAIEHYRRAAALDPSLAPAHVNLARALVAIEDLPAARDALERAVEFDPENAEASQALQEIDRILGQPTQRPP